jgi:L-asparaginase
MPRVLVLLTGGTLSMRRGKDGTLAPAADLDVRMRAEVPALARIAELTTEHVFSLDSADMGPEHWLILAERVHRALSAKDVDGVVVVHGTDTMAYAASALALLLGPLPKPVVLTGAQRPLEEERTDARANLVDAVTVATLPVPEVSVVFASRALRGVRATKSDAWDLAAFESPNAPPLVELGVGVDVAPHVRAPAPLAPFDARLERSVLALRVFPGLDAGLLSAALRSGVKGLVLEAYGTGNLPHGPALLRVLEEAREQAVPVLVVSQCLRGRVQLGAYEGGAAAERAGALSGGDMTPEAAVAKLMIGLGRFGPGSALREYLLSDVVGERSDDASFEASGSVRFWRRR